MNKQRKVVITTTYNEMGIIIDTKVEEVAQPNLQPTCNQFATDTISRQAAIDEGMSYINGDCFCDKEDFAKYIEFIEQLPPIQPEPHWIPCSERLPEESNVYIVTVDKDYIPPRCDAVDTLWWEAKSKEWQYENRNAFVKYPAPVLAWMPLPEEWEGKKNA